MSLTDTTHYCRHKMMLLCCYCCYHCCHCRCDFVVCCLLVEDGIHKSRQLFKKALPVPWQNVHAWNVLVMFWHPRNVHPTQCPSVHCITVTFDLNVDGLFVHHWTFRSERFGVRNVTGEHPIPCIFDQPNSVIFFLMVTFPPIVFNVNFSYENCDIPAHSNF
jgi:hypothetical protein